MPNHSLYGKCRKFFNIDLITGHLKHEYAVISRFKKCGVDDTEFIKNKN